MHSSADALAAAFTGSSLGLRRGVVRIVPPADAWSGVFADVHAALIGDAPEAVVAIEHIGSTSVPGLAAKPILDIGIGFRRPVRADEAHDEIHDWLTGIGFLLRGDANGVRPDRMYGYELESMIRLVNAHVLEHGSAEWRHYLGFRDFLRVHPAERDAYAALKAELSLRHPDDRMAYIDGKETFIVARRARPI